jgi:hypothetical protein
MQSRTDVARRKNLAKMRAEATRPPIRSELREQQGAPITDSAWGEVPQVLRLHHQSLKPIRPIAVPCDSDLEPRSAG